MIKKYPNLLRRFRKARGLSQRQAARILGVGSTSMISRWEKGISLPNTTNVFKLAALYRTMADPMFPNLTRMLKDELIKREEQLRQEKCA
jgi:transcriptional regulator with XRE-family HTH domain